MLTEVEACRADEVADVLDEQQIKTSQWQVMQRPMHEVRIEVAGRSGGDLYRRHAVGPDAGRIVVGLEVALDDPDPVPPRSARSSPPATRFFRRPVRT